MASGSETQAKLSLMALYKKETRIANQKSKEIMESVAEIKRINEEILVQASQIKEAEETLVE